ncbi:MAG: sigma-70 family RNA polymerase sigma factor [Acidobacteria bacterium]|nr:sigma-70 family RNA polymerase sigma factor [Acidobacteriota bacterium]
MSALSPTTFTARLQAWRGGDESAREDVIAFVYQELCRLAQSYLNNERKGHTLDANALVHEAYVQLCGDGPLEWTDRQHFFRVAGKTMRHILIDYARARNAAKRPDQRLRLSLSDANQESILPREIDLLALEEALARLEEFSPRTVQIIELRYFSGLTETETADTLGLSVATIKREWKFGRRWIQRHMSGLPNDEDDPNKNSDQDAHQDPHLQ